MVAALTLERPWRGAVRLLIRVQRSCCLDTVCMLTYALKRGSGCRSHLVILSQSVPKAHRLASWLPTGPAVRSIRAGTGGALVAEMCETVAIGSDGRVRLP